MATKKSVRAEKIECPICGALVHSIASHLKTDHPEMTLKEFQKRFPDAPIMSEWAKQKVEEVLKQREEESRVSGLPFLHEVFGFERTDQSVLSSIGKKPIPIHVLEKSGGPNDTLIPAINEGYVFDGNEFVTILLKKFLIIFHEEIKILIPVIIGILHDMNTSLVIALCSFSDTSI